MTGFKIVVDGEEVWATHSPGEPIKFIEIRLEGYGENNAEDGCGAPVVIDDDDGEQRLVVFGDINSEDPTHIIRLDNAKERERRATVS